MMTVQTPPALEPLKLGAIIVADSPSASPLPLEHTDVVAMISGPLASVSVTQRFGNPFKSPVELAYLFPLPYDAAVVDYELRIGGRVVRATVQEIEAARRAYGEARDKGKRAGLLEQRRPNLFSSEIANVQPGETIIATIRYQQRLRYDDGCYSFVFPMGLTPKYHSDPTEGRSTDAPVAAEGDAIGAVDIALTVDAGSKAGKPESPSHSIEVTSLDERRFSIRLAGHTIPNKDFVLRYAVAEAELSAAAWSSASEGGATVMITALPPRLTEEFEPPPREFIFVIDRSGSMSGGPILQARNALRACLRSLGPQDSFNILAFDHQIEWMNGSACHVTQQEIERADQWLNKIDARGGTEILEAIDAALKLPADRERRRYIVFLTDGAVSADLEAIGRIERQIESARLFTFGIGPSVNRSLLARMAELGRGTAEFLQLNEDIEEAIIRFQDRVAYPVLQDLALEWEGATSWDVYPARLPDLYIGQPLEIVARARPTGEGPPRLHIKGRRGNETVTLNVNLPMAASSEPVILRAWARARIDDLLDRLRNDLKRTAELRAEIIGLSVAHNLLTPFTAFVAVDSEVTETTDRRRVSISTPLPEGLEMEGFFGGPDLIAGSMLTQQPAAPMMLHALSEAELLDSGEPMHQLSSGGLSKLVSSAQKLMGLDRAASKASDVETGTSEDPLRWLARTQNVSGSWGAGADEVEMTASALLAFARAGHTHRAGHYRRQIARAIKWLLKATAGGFAAHARAQALIEVAAGDADLLREAHAARAALPPLTAPSTATYASLDDLRVAALLGKGGEVAPALLKSAKGDLVRAWRAVLNPVFRA